MPAPRSGGAPAPTVDTAPRLSQWPPDFERLAPGWRALIEPFWASAEGRQLQTFVHRRLAEGAVIYPPQPLLALQLTPPESVRAVILGQDPYHGPGQAYGLAFAVPAGVRTPPSLRNIRAELAREYGREPAGPGLLEHWARQGVLLLNTSLTVEAGQPGSHAAIGWQRLTARLFRHLVDGPRPLAFLLWGAHAQAQMPPAAGRGAHLWCCANHPSPLSARRPPVPFIGCGHFRRVNDFLAAAGQTPVDWLGETLPQAMPLFADRPKTVA